MTQYSTLTVNLSNSHPNKLKSGMKNGIQVALKISSNVVGDFPLKLLLTDTQVLRLRKAFTNNSSANI